MDLAYTKKVCSMILLVGYGYWGKNLARNFQKHLSSICDVNPINLAEANTAFPFTKLSDNFELAVKDDSVKGVVIATKAKTHFDLAIKAIDAGKDVWIEKPVCETLDEVNELKKYSIKKQKIVFVDHTFCYHPAVQKLKTIDIGNPLYYDSIRISLGLFQPDIDVLLDLAIHDVSIINFLYPNLQLLDKQIIKNNHVVDIANQVILNLKFSNKFTANINCNWVSPVKKRHIILAGNNASVVYDDLSNEKIKIYKTGIIDKDYNMNSLSGTIVPNILTTEALENGVKEFLQSIKKRTTPLTSIEYSIKPMEWLLC